MLNILKWMLVVMFATSTAFMLMIYIGRRRTERLVQNVIVKNQALLDSRDLLRAEKEYDAATSEYFDKVEDFRHDFD